MAQIEIAIKCRSRWLRAPATNHFVRHGSPRRPGRFFVWIVFFGKAKQGREVADEFDLEFAIDRAQTDFIDKRAEYFCSLVARCIVI